MSNAACICAESRSSRLHRESLTTTPRASVASVFSFSGLATAINRWASAIAALRFFNVSTCHPLYPKTNPRQSSAARISRPERLCRPCTRSLCCGGFVVVHTIKSDSVDCSPSGRLMRLLTDSDGVSPDRVSAAVPTCGVPRIVNRVTAAGSDQPRRTLHCAMYAPTAMITSAIAAAAAGSIVCLLAFVAGLHLAGRLADDSRGRLLKSRSIVRNFKIAPGRSQSAFPFSLSIALSTSTASTQMPFESPFIHAPHSSFSSRYRWAPASASAACVMRW